jgi:hypothetical protein
MCKIILLIVNDDNFVVVDMEISFSSLIMEFNVNSDQLHCHCFQYGNKLIYSNCGVGHD